MPCLFLVSTYGTILVLFLFIFVHICMCIRLCASMHEGFLMLLACLHEMMEGGSLDLCERVEG